MLPDGFAAWRAEHFLFREPHAHPTPPSRVPVRAFSFEGASSLAPPLPVGQGIPIWGFLDWLEGFNGRNYWNHNVKPLRRRVIVLERNFVIEEDAELEQERA